jgi:hypothetical protein
MPERLVSYLLGRRREHDPLQRGDCNRDCNHDLAPQKTFFRKIMGPSLRLPLISLLPQPVACLAHREIAIHLCRMPNIMPPQQSRSSATISTVDAGAPKYRAAATAAPAITIQNHPRLMLFEYSFLQRAFLQLNEPTLPI